MTKVTISGYYGFKNFGDELILSVLTSKLKELNADITVFSVNPKFTEKYYGVKSEKTFNLLSVIKTIWNTDILISGGGSLFQDTTSINSLLYYSFVLGLAQFLRKKTIIFAQGIGPLNSPISRFLVKFLFKRTNSITVRDEESLELLKKYGINAKLVTDPVFCIDFPLTEKNNALGVQLRGQCNITPKFLTNLASVVAQTKFNNIKVFSLQTSIDYDICQKFTQLIKNFAPEKNIQIIKENCAEEIAKLDTLISMRYHALVVGLKSEVKCVGINYDPKILALCNEYDLPILEFEHKIQTINEKIQQAKSVKIKAEKCKLEIEII